MSGFQALPMVVALLACGCAATTPYPDEWTRVTADDEWCRHPSGNFANLPVGSSESAPDAPLLPLAEVFFGPLLSGFEVTHLSFETLDSGELRVRPWVGQSVLQEVRTIPPAADRCGRERWLVRSGWETHATDTAYIGFWSAGTLLPLASQGYFSLERNADGQLVVYAVARTAGMALYFIPFRARIADAWFAYAPHPALEIHDVQ